ncbi:growth hormone secretagogue receptor type 1-like [Pecten maximus]|uniref:growth hormone secretagogue receptor type 1-like n=1 Tax=Pecten maximus TaxID=6579 RepID=UPI00145912AB|nr:growth hormone secretagogue receptor type 1-like [Pecten maximus]
MNGLRKVFTPEVTTRMYGLTHLELDRDLCNLTESIGMYDTKTAWMMMCPILLVLGTVTGVINLMVLTRRKIRKNSSAMFFIALAVADLIVLHTGLTRQWLIYSFDLDIRMKNNFLCKTNYFIVYLSLQMSSWTLVLITIERMIVVQFPYKAKVLCTRTRALSAILFIFLVLFLVNMHSLIGGDITTTTNSFNSTTYVVCGGITEHYHTFRRYYWGWIDLLIFCVLPSCIILALNTIIIVKLTKRYRTRRKTLPAHIIHSSRRQMSFENFTKSWTSTISLLILLDAWFIVCTLPVCVVLVLYNWCAWFQSEDEIKLVWVTTNILMYSNNTFNFFLYCISGSKFREELKDIFCQCFGYRAAVSRTDYSVPNQPLRF